MGMTYVRRFRMAFDLTKTRLPEPILPERYWWVAWSERLMSRHAAVKYASFQFELDSYVFPCLGDVEGCRRLMQEIADQDAFLPQATWLIMYRGRRERVATDCGTIQGLERNGSSGAVQNVGVVPEHRGMGLGRALLLKALDGFRRARLKQVFLEVTAENEQAVELYRSVGFRLARTMYKPVKQTVQNFETAHA